MDEMPLNVMYLTLQFAGRDCLFKSYNCALRMVSKQGRRIWVVIRMYLVRCLQFKLLAHLVNWCQCLMVVPTFLSQSVLSNVSISPQLNELCCLIETGTNTFSSSSAWRVVSKSLPKVGYGW